MNSKKVLLVLLVCLMGFGVLAIATNAQGSRVSKKDVDNTIFINVNNSNVGIRETDKDELHLEYSSELFECNKRIDNNAIIVNIKNKEGAKPNFLDRVVVYIPKNSAENLVVKNVKSGVAIERIDMTLSIENISGATSITVDKESLGSITYKSDHGSGSLLLDKGLKNYVIKLIKKDSAVSTPFEDISEGDTTFKYSNGNASNTIIVDLEASAFSLDIK